MTIHHDIDRVFKDGLADYTQKPPSFVWDNISQALDSKRIKRRRNAIYSIAASAALLLSFGAGYLFNLFNIENQPLAQQTQEQVISIEKEPKNETLITNPVVKRDEVEESNAIEAKENTENNTQENPIKIETTEDSPPKSTTPKAKKVSSSGTLLPPMFASGNTFEEENNEQATAPIFFDKKKEINEEAKLLGMHMEMRTLKTAPLKRELKYEYREVPMYGNAFYEETPKPKSNKWALAVSAAPLVSYRDVSTSSMVFDATLYNADNTSSYEQGYTNEQPLVSYSVGTNVSYGLGKRWKVHSGIYISEIGQTSKGININTDVYFNNNPGDNKYAINTSYGNVAINGGTNELLSSMNYSVNTEVLRPSEAISEKQTSTLSADLVQTLDYIEIPILMSYKVVDRKLGINISGGVSANILYDNSIYLRENGNNHELNADVSDLKSTNYNGIVGLGMEYPIITQLHFNLQPTLRYSLSPINNSGTVYPYSFGLYTGLRYSF